MDIQTAIGIRRDNGESVSGFPMVWNGKMYIAYAYTFEDCGSTLLRQAVINPKTLCYQTGKPDKHGEMIFCGMKVKCWMPSLEIFIYGIVEYNNNEAAYQINCNPGENVRGYEWLGRFKQNQIEIAKG